MLRSTEDPLTHSTMNAVESISGSSLSKERYSLKNIGSISRTSPKHMLLPFIFICRHLWHFIEDDLRITLAAQSLTIPIFLFQFHRLSLVSPLSNVLIGWTIAPITILGWLVVVLQMVWQPLGQVAAWVTWLIVQYLVWVVQITSSLPFASVSFK